MNPLDAPIGGAPNRVFGSPRMASGSKGERGFGGWVVFPISVASPRAARVSGRLLWLSSQAGRRLDLVGVVATNRQTDNNGLERTRSRANGLMGPCRSIRCSTGLCGKTSTAGSD